MDNSLVGHLKLIVFSSDNIVLLKKDHKMILKNKRTYADDTNKTLLVYNINT